MSQATMFPLVHFDRLPLPDANACLESWGHQMGALRRPMNGDAAYALFEEGEPVAVAISSTLIQPRVGGGLSWLTRDNTIELSRLCARDPHLCRVALRLWREFVFPRSSKENAISYQDRNLHTGNTYRFDGWKRAAFSHSGADKRSDRKGRDKWIWVWPPAAAVPAGVAP